MFKIPMEMEVDNLETAAKIMSGTVSIKEAVARNTSSGRIDEFLSLSLKLDGDSGTDATLKGVALGAIIMGSAWGIYEGIKWLGRQRLNKKKEHIVGELCEFSTKIKTNTMMIDDYDRLISLLERIKKNEKLRVNIFANEDAYELICSLASFQKSSLECSALAEHSRGNENQTTILVEAVQHLLARKDQYYYAV